MRSLSALALFALTTPAIAEPEDDHDPPVVEVAPDDPPPVEPAPEVTLPPAPPPAIDARTGITAIRDRPAPTGTFTIGAGFSPDDHFIASAKIEQPNLFRTGQRLALAADLSAIRQRFSLQYDIPRIVPGIDLHTELFATKRAYPGFTREGAGGAVSLSHRIDRHTRIYGRYRVEAVEVTDGTGDAISRVEPGPNLGNGNIATLGGGIVHDTLDQPFIPRRGTRIEVLAERADKRWGSDYNFERFAGSIDHARGFGPFTLRLHGHAAHVRSRDPMGVPLSERLVHDGHADVRGYALDSISPVGDNLEAVGRVELELPIWKRAGLSIAGWADAGLRHNSDSMWGPTDSPLLRRSVGLSIIWRSPIGPLRFDWAIPLDGRDRDAQFLFGLGGWRW